MNIKKYIKISLWILIIIGISLIIVHGLWPNLFLVDGISILILFILSIPYLAFFLRKAKFPGAEFEFKDEIDKTKDLVKKSIEKSRKDNQANGRKTLYFEHLKTESNRDLLDADPVLALAALRIEIEKKLKMALKIVDFKGDNRLSISRLIEIFHKKNVLKYEQIKALRKIINMCNKAVHGFSISKDEANNIIGLTEELNKSFAVGYSLDFTDNPDYENHGLLCK